MRLIPRRAAVLICIHRGAHRLRDCPFQHRFAFHKILPSWLALVGPASVLSGNHAAGLQSPEGVTPAF